MILVAEDNQLNKRVIEEFLMLDNHDVEVVANGALAVERFSILKPDLILMDIAMPVMSGLDATRAIRKLEEGSPGHTPIIAVTAYVVEAEKELCFQAGMDAYISKPIKLNNLLETISTWLDGSQNIEGSRPPVVSR